MMHAYEVFAVLQLCRDGVVALGELHSTSSIAEAEGEIRVLGAGLEYVTSSSKHTSLVALVGVHKDGGFSRDFVEIRSSSNARLAVSAAFIRKSYSLVVLGEQVPSSDPSARSREIENIVQVAGWQSRHRNLCSWGEGVHGSEMPTPAHSFYFLFLSSVVFSFPIPSQRTLHSK